MKLRIHISGSDEAKNTNVPMQRWENEGGHPPDFTSAPDNTPGLLYDGQQFEVLNSHLVEEEGETYQVVEVKLLNTKER